MSCILHLAVSSCRVECLFKIKNTATACIFAIKGRRTGADQDFRKGGPSYTLQAKKRGPGVRPPAPPDLPMQESQGDEG